MTLRIATALLATLAATACGQQIPLSGPLYDGKQALAAKDYVQAQAIYLAYTNAHPENVAAAVGLGDADMALHRYEQAELAYRHAVALQPELWLAHKHLVLLEARLHRWEEFDRERELLRGARERGAPGITARESDVIDTFEVRGREWIVREYFEPVGRSETRYNFEYFSAAGKAEQYISLESADAAQAALDRAEQIRIGADKPQPATTFALNWYTGKGHGTIRRYAGKEPSYEAVRADVLRWFRTQASSR